MVCLGPALTFFCACPGRFQNAVTALALPAKASNDLTKRLMSSALTRKMKDDETKLLGHFVDLLEKMLMTDKSKRAAPKVRITLRLTRRGENIDWQACAPTGPTQSSLSALRWSGCPPFLAVSVVLLLLQSCPRFHFYVVLYPTVPHAHVRASLRPQRSTPVTASASF